MSRDDETFERRLAYIVQNEKHLRADLAAAIQDRDHYDNTRSLLSAELDAVTKRCSHYHRIAAELTDKLNGTPCAEIRWQQERDALRELLREARDFIASPENAERHPLATRIDAALGGGDE